MSFPIAATVVALVLVAQSGGSDSPFDQPSTAPTAAQPTTAPPTTAPPVASSTTTPLAPTAWLATLVPVEGNFHTAGAAVVAGRTYTNSIITLIGDFSSGTATFAINGGYARFRTTVGLRDDTEQGTSIAFTVTGDGRQLATGTVGLGMTLPVDVDVTGVERLTLSEREVNGKSDHWIVFGSAQLVGSPVASTRPSPPVPANAVVLSDLAPKAGGTILVGPGKVNGVTYSHSIMSLLGDPSSGFAVWDVGRRYKRFQASIGLRDDTKEGTRIQWRILTDGFPVKEGVAVAGQVTTVDVDVTGVTDLRIEESELAGLDDKWIVLGNAVLIP